MEEKGHSEEYFGESRDFWWNKDFLDLMAKRWELDKHSRLLDVGCGMCHWSRLLVPYLKSGSQIHALDRDIKWAKGNDSITEYFRKSNATISYKHGDTEAIPYEDNLFDVVTCQTVLIHVKNPQKAVNEMKRVLKPGGIIICVEPNNVIQSLLMVPGNQNDSISEIIDRVLYFLVYQKGKEIMGEGNNSVGDLLPGLFSISGLENIQVYLSDKASPLLPPYESPEQIETLKMLAEWENTGTGFFDKDEAFSKFKACGKEYESSFESHWKNFTDELKKHSGDISDHSHYGGGAHLMYLVSGIKKVN